MLKTFILVSRELRPIGDVFTYTPYFIAMYHCKRKIRPGYLRMQFLKEGTFPEFVEETPYKSHTTKKLRNVSTGTKIRRKLFIKGI